MEGRDMGHVPDIEQVPTTVTRCRDCNNEIRWVHNSQSGEKLPIDPRAMELHGTERYLMDQVEPGEPQTVTRVADRYPDFAHGDHRMTCPKVRYS